MTAFDLNTHQLDYNLEGTNHLPKDESHVEDLYSVLFGAQRVEGSHLGKTENGQESHDTERFDDHA